MDSAVKIFQSAFYIVGSIVAVLTYLKAKNGLLNSVNTEYQKRVIDRLASLSDDLFREFDWGAEENWTNDKNAEEVVSHINSEVLRNKHEMLTGSWEYCGIPIPRRTIKIREEQMDISNYRRCCVFQGR